MKKLQDIALNSDMLNKLIDKKLAVFQMFIVKDESENNKFILHLKDKNSSFTVRLAEFKSYQQYLRWLSEAAILRVAASPKQVKQARQIYKHLFFAAKDPMRINPLEKED